VQRCRLLAPSSGADAEEEGDGTALYQAALVERLLQEGAAATAAARGAEPHDATSAQAAVTAFATHTLHQLAAQRLLSRAALHLFLHSRSAQVCAQTPRVFLLQQRGAVWRETSRPMMTPAFVCKLGSTTRGLSSRVTITSYIREGLLSRACRPHCCGLVSSLGSGKPP
jgi:hypothetical protein